MQIIKAQMLDLNSNACMRAQVVCITDPVLATQVLRSKVVDKLRFQYSFLDPVSTCLHPCSFTRHATAQNMPVVDRISLRRQGPDAASSMQVAHAYSIVSYLCLAPF